MSLILLRNFVVLLNMMHEKIVSIDALEGLREIVSAALDSISTEIFHFLFHFCF
jgi:hypothetical protein